MSDEESTTEIMHPATMRPAVREDLAGLVELGGGELATQALMAQAKAAIEARYKMALLRPRNGDNVRVNIMRECRRPKFADEAIYAVPRGKKQLDSGQWVENIVEGPSIRFVELALRHMGNTYTKVMITHEDDRKVILNVSVTDLESNTTYDSDLTVAKTMERQKLRDGQLALGTRTNSAGKRVYIVEAPDGEMLGKTNALTSKAIRTQGLRLIDGDIVAEAMELCNKILADRTAKDPDGERKRVIDAFADMRVMPVDLEAYLGHPLSGASPAEIDTLRKLYRGIRDGATTWHELMDDRAKQPASSSTPAPAPAPVTEPASTPAPAAPAQSPPAAAAKETPPAATEVTPLPTLAVVRTQAEIDKAGADGTWTPAPPPESDRPQTATAAQSSAGRGSFDKAAEDARARESERKAAAEKPKRGTAAAKEALKGRAAPAAKPEPAAPQSGLFDGGAPPPGDDDLPAWAGGGEKADPGPVDFVTGKPDDKA